MSTPAQTTSGEHAAWVIAEMPPGYANRTAEIQRLAAELQDMARYGRLLTGAGLSLGEAIRDLFTAMGCETELVPDADGTRVFARLEQGRLLIQIAGDHRVEKKGPEIAQVFQLLHEVAGDRDHVVLVTNCDAAKPPAERGDGVTPDALAFLARLGISQVHARTLFTLWKVMLQDSSQARQYAQRLHSHPGGAYELPASALL